MGNQKGCPKCGSGNLQIINDSTIETKGFGAGKGCLGVICFGPIGLLCGMCGMGKSKTSNSAYRMCVDCGEKFK